MHVWGGINPVRLANAGATAAGIWSPNAGQNVGHQSGPGEQVGGRTIWTPPSPTRSDLVRPRPLGYGNAGQLGDGSYYDAMIALGSTLKGYWRCDETSFYSARDSTGLHNLLYDSTGAVFQMDASQFAAAGLLSGDPDGDALLSSSLQDYIQTGGGAIVGPTLHFTAFTMMCWAQAATASDWGLMGQTNGGSSNGCYLYVSTNDILVMEVPGSTSLIATANPAFNTGPHMVACTYDGTDGRLYMDGVLIAGPTATTVTASSTDFVIGNYGFPSGSFNSNKIGEVAICDTALTAGQLLNLADIGLGIVAAGGTFPFIGGGFFPVS